MRIKDKHWKKEFELDILNEWKNTDYSKFKKDSKKKVYSIDTPPPYVNSPIHIGHATTYVLMDVFARFRRMNDFNVLFPLGLDRNGLPIEMAAEKRFKIKFNETPRNEFLNYCKQMLEESSIDSINSFFRLGISFNSYEKNDEIGSVYYTDDIKYRTLTQSIFIDLYKKGLIYEDKRIVNYCPGCKTTLADAEVIYEDKPSYFNYVKFKVKETNEDIIIATTRPELISTCAMVIFNPKDERYKHLDGKTAITPLFNKEVPIKAHPQAAMDKGTGLVMMASMGDLHDIRFFREMRLTPKIAIDKNGIMNENAGFLKGLKVKEARKKIIEELKNKDLLVKQEEILHRTPICERSKDEIEFIEMSELYLKQIEFKDELKKIANQIDFYSEKSRKILLDWIDSLVIDWPITRKRYYATEVPLWYCKKCGKPYVPEPGKYYQPWKDKPPIDKCPYCGSKEFIGDTRVFDTWFDSSNSPLYILQYQKDDDFFMKNKPCTLRPQGKEIIRTWLYYTLLKGYLLFKEPIFKEVWINYHVVDETGKKMSKSIGNVINPNDIIDKYGAEAFRLWTAVEGNLDRTDFRCSFERIESQQKTLTKLWNISRFISGFELNNELNILIKDYISNDNFNRIKERIINPIDKLILNKLNELIDYTKESFFKYDIHNPVIKIRHFIWEIFASHYLEIIKPRSYNNNNFFTKQEQESALLTVNVVLINLLKLLYPVIPFITYKIFKDIYNISILDLKYPNNILISFDEFSFDEIQTINNVIWKYKKDNQLSLKSEINSIILNPKFKSVEKTIRIMHNIKQVSYFDDNSQEIIKINS